MCLKPNTLFEIMKLLKKNKGIHRSGKKYFSKNDNPC